MKLLWVDSLFAIHWNINKKSSNTYLLHQQQQKATGDLALLIWTNTTALSLAAWVSHKYGQSRKKLHKWLIPSLGLYTEKELDFKLKAGHNVNSTTTSVLIPQVMGWAWPDVGRRERTLPKTIANAKKKSKNGPFFSSGRRKRGQRRRVGYWDFL